MCTIFDRDMSRPKQPPTTHHGRGITHPLQGGFLMHMGETLDCFMQSYVAPTHTEIHAHTYTDICGPVHIPPYRHLLILQIMADIRFFPSVKAPLLAMRICLAARRSA